MIVFGCRHRYCIVENSLQINVNNVLLKFSSIVKNLGIIIDNDLRFRENTDTKNLHITHIFIHVVTFLIPN